MVIILLFFAFIFRPPLRLRGSIKSAKQSGECFIRHAALLNKGFVE
ncbi:hypothetical protein CKS_3525 [Pantoea stewartii subsp. stewartii DC283]|uniref:Uncharacterized protein n=1 Tax=Pantoea stewartii subsp. stewartii DC283 TaxID=660596 RepID=H3RCK3_PANSE|nr:hypothetical protein CKS_3525 [Pantoea stewartii subsp. stewartii DC283]